jgi:ribosomal protein L37E
MSSSSKLVTREKLRTRCRKLHFSIHSPNKTIIWCDDCQNNSELVDKNKCGCCGAQVERAKSYAFLKKVINTGLIQHKSLIKCWSSFPTQEPIYPEIILKGGLVCEIPIKYLALANENRKPNEIYPLLEKHVRIKGYKITVPDKEELDVSCTRCSDKLKITKTGLIYCPSCINNMNHSEKLLK